jgi:hypothetical protein
MRGGADDDAAGALRAGVRSALFAWRATPPPVCPKLHVCARRCSLPPATAVAGGGTPLRRFSVSFVSGDAAPRTVSVEVPVSDGGGVSCASLRAAVATALGLGRAAFTLTDATLPDVSSDAHAAALRPGCTLHCVPLSSDAATATAAALCERISFPPHPKTLTDSGDYVEKNGKAPVAFALSDLIDNALAATRDNAAARRRRCITVAFVRGRSAAESLIAVTDNGRAMTADGLKGWCARAHERLVSRVRACLHGFTFSDGPFLWAHACAPPRTYPHPHPTRRPADAPRAPFCRCAAVGQGGDEPDRG